MSRLELIMAYFECTELEARNILAIDDGQSVGDMIAVKDGDE